MAADTFSLATQLAVLLAARAPAWRAQTASDVTSSPLALGEGAALDNAPRALVAVQLRELWSARTARLSIPTLNIGDSFQVTVSGTTVTYDSTGDANLDQVVADLAAAINANGTIAALVTAVAVRASDDSTTVGVRDSVRIRGDTPADFSVNFVRSSGTVSVVAAVADAVSGTVRLHHTLRAAAGTTAPSGWYRADVGYSISDRGLMLPLVTAGTDRLYVQVTSLTKSGSDGAGVTIRTPNVSIGPADLES